MDIACYVPQVEKEKASSIEHVETGPCERHVADRWSRKKQLPHVRVVASNATALTMEGFETRDCTMGLVGDKVSQRELIDNKSGTFTKALLQVNMLVFMEGDN